MTDMTETAGNDNSVTDTGAVTPEVKDESQENRTFTQADVDKIVQARLYKHKRKYEGIDVSEYKNLKSAEEEREIEAMKKREEFDKVLSQQKDKFSNEITTLRNELTSLKVDGTLLNTAASRNAVNPEQVAQLLRDRVGLDETGRPVVYDSGNVVYDPDTAEPKSLESLVNEFLDSNNHFLRSGPSGVTSSGAAGSAPTSKQTDLSQLDMTKASDREIYKKLKSEGKI
jgi:DNA-binding transcriptional MerR regulator